MTNGANDWGVTFGRITFLEGILRSHGNIESLSRSRDILFTVNRREQQDTLRILCVDTYAFSLTMLRRALAEFHALSIIFVGGAWNGYTEEAKKSALKQHLGVYNAQEISGGLWKTTHWNYNRTDDDGNPVFAYNAERI